MMRNALTPIALLIAACSIAQPFERVEVVTVDSTRSSADLYRTAERWFVDTFKDAQEVVQLRDSATHTLVGKGAALTAYVSGKGLNMVSGQMIFRYSLEVQTKDGRYRARVYDATLSDGYYSSDTCCLGPCHPIGGLRGMEKRMAVILEDTRRHVCPQTVAALDGLFASLKAAMVKPKDDW